MMSLKSISKESRELYVTGSTVSEESSSDIEEQHLHSKSKTPSSEPRPHEGPSPTQAQAMRQHKEVPKLFGIPTVLLAGICYCAASGSMVLLNKHALSSFEFKAPTVLLFYQCFVAVLLVKLCELARFVKLQPLKPDLMMLWFPVNLIFVGMIGTSFYALQTMGVGMVTVWKNVSNFVTALGDVFIYKKTYTLGVWAVLLLMMASAIVGASTDSKFTWMGYSWQVANCFFTSAYVLYLRSVMDRVSEHTTNKQKMDEFSMVYYNNLLSLFPIAGLIFAFNEHSNIMNQPALYNPQFLFISTAGAFIGFAISFSSLWFLSQTTATLYSLTGALNKIPVAIVGIVAFQESTNPKNLGSIIIGLAAGVLFVWVKK